MSSRTPRMPAGGTVGVYAAPVATAAPDTVNINRDRAIRRMIGRGLQGHSGTVIGYDRGDPANSITAVMAPMHSPTQAIAQVGAKDQILLAQPEIYDQASNDPDLSAYEQNLFRRILR